MIRHLEEQLRTACETQIRIAGMVDVTGQMQVAFNTADRTVIRARLRPADQSHPLLIVVMGFRSHMLAPFGQVKLRHGSYLPCDIPGLVPGMAAVVSHYDHGLIANAMVRGDVIRLVLGFEGVPDNRGDALNNLARSVYRFFRRWHEWTEVLLSTVERDPVVGEWGTDWREFLAGESGFMVMPWFRPMTYAERAVALERVVVASKVLLSSVLNSDQLTDPLIRDVMGWLSDLTPLPQVFYEAEESGEAQT
ncbi:MAG: hypothetical protein ACTSPX_01660 [Candidatus Thorarchaeota archaeon]